MKNPDNHWYVIHFWHITYLFIFLPYAILGAFALRYLIKKIKGKKRTPIETALAEEKRYLKHVASICNSFVEGGAEGAYQSILSLTEDSKAYAMLTLPWLFDTVLSKDETSQSNLESLEKFMEISGIKSSRIPYPQAERMLKSLILSEIPCEQKEKITESSIVSAFSSETRRATELKQMDPATRKKAEKEGVSRRIIVFILAFIWTFVFWAISIIIFICGMFISFFHSVHLMDQLLFFSTILWSVIFFILGIPKWAKRANRLSKPKYSKIIQAIKDDFVEKGAEEAYRQTLSLVENDNTRARARSVRALPLIADTLLGKDALMARDRASFIKFMEISGVDSSQIPDELKERIVESFLLSKIPYEQKEGLLRPVILRAKSNVATVSIDAPSPSLE
jgi:hypothetical protein